MELAVIIAFCVIIIALCHWAVYPLREAFRKSLKINLLLWANVFWLIGWLGY